VLALCSCLLAGAPTRASAGDPPAGRSTSTLAAWWARPGTPGWTPEAAFTFGLPAVFAGHAAGGFELRDPLAPGARPAPGVAEAQAPLAWYDSAAVVVGEGAAWRGFGAAIVAAEPVLAAPAGRTPRSVWTVVSGDAGIDRNGIFVARGDERSWVRGGAVAGERGGLGDLDRAGEHLWTVSAGARRGPHVLEAGFAQRGAAERQRVGAADAARGESGFARWAWSDSAHSLGVRVSRGHDERESFASDPLVLYEDGRREAQSNAAELSGWSRRGRAELGARLEVREGRVVRAYAGVATDRWRERSAWAAVRAILPAGPGRLEAQLGGGRHDAAARKAERWQLAPSLSWRAGVAPRSLRLFAERVVHPVWSDLAPDAVPFVQDTWLGGAEARATRGTARAGALVVAGRTGARATLVRFPVRDAALRAGWQPEAARSSFALASAEAAGAWRALVADASGFVLARDGDGAQGRVDPSVGGTMGLGAAFRLFAGDFGVRLRGEVAWVGQRRSDTRTASLPDATLPGYATFAAGAEMTLGDATIVLRADGLEDVAHEHTWADLGDAPEIRLARSRGRTFRFELTWPLFN